MLFPASLNQICSDSVDLKLHKFIGDFNTRLTGCQEEIKTSYSLPNILGLMYQFLRRQDGSLSFLFLTPTVGEFFDLELWNEELDTDTLIAMIHPEDLTSFYDSIADAAQKLESWRWVGRFILPSEKIKWVQWEAQPSLQGNGNIFWNGLLIDVTSHYQLHSEVERLSFLLALAERLQNSSHLNEIAAFALHYFVQATNSAFGDVKVIRHIDTEQPACSLTHYITAEFLAVYGDPAFSDIEVQMQQQIPQGEGLFWQVVETGIPLFIKNYQNHSQDFSVFYYPEFEEVAIFPLAARNGTVLGILTLDARNLHHIQGMFKKDLLLAACRILGACLEQAQVRERLQRTHTELELTSQKLQSKSHQLEIILQELQTSHSHLPQPEIISSTGSRVPEVERKMKNSVSLIQDDSVHAQCYFYTILSLLQIYQKHYQKLLNNVQSDFEELDLDFIVEDIKLLGYTKLFSDKVCAKSFNFNNVYILGVQNRIINLYEGIEKILAILESCLQNLNAQLEFQGKKQPENFPLIACYTIQLNQVFRESLMNVKQTLKEICQPPLLVTD